MSNSTHGFSRKRVAVTTVTVIISVCLWYAFRPEKLFVNKKVNEGLPSNVGELMPLFTGQFSSGAHSTSGRATIYQQPDGSRVLRLTNFSTSNGPAVHVILSDRTGVMPDKDMNLGDSKSADYKNRDLGELKGNLGDQSYPIPSSVDIGKSSTIAIYCARYHVVFGTAKLELF
jgi:Electron transfer DM13